jgi:hypothetical protein
MLVVSSIETSNHFHSREGSWNIFKESDKGKYSDKLVNDRGKLVKEKLNCRERSGKG